MQDSDWQIEVDYSTFSEWSRTLDLFEDANFFQTWSYGRIRWGDKNLSHLVLRRGGEVMGMAQLRIVRPTPWRFGIAYLRWGPICERRGRPLETDVVVRMARALEDEYVYKRKLFLRILPNAFVGSSRATIIQSAFCRFTCEPLAANETYRTVVLDLAPDLEELRRSLDKKWRNQLTQAEKNRLIVTSGSGRDDYATFCQMYYEMRRRKTFETTVDVEEFGRIQEDLPESQRMRILICEDKGKPVAGLVASAIGHSGIYLLGATGDDGVRSKGAYLLQWVVIKWLKENGFKWYDLGGIDPEQNPGVYHFKRGLSGTEVSQISPQVSCTSSISSTVVRTALTIHRALDGLSIARRVRPPLNRN